MWLVLIPYGFALVFTGSFLAILWRHGRLLRIPGKLMWRVGIIVMIVIAQMLLVVCWHSRPGWLPVLLSVLAVGAAIYSCAPVIARHPDALFSPAAIARWRTVRARLRRRTQQ